MPSRDGDWENTMFNYGLEEMGYGRSREQQTSLLTYAWTFLPSQQP